MDVLKLRDWYKTPLGHTARRMVQASMNELWPSLRGKRVLVLGFGLPYISLWPKEADVYCAMMGYMGSLPWPETGKNRTAFCWDDQLPFRDEFFDAILIVHALEYSDNDFMLMDECQRVLKNDGQMLAVVPNRASVWCRREISPFARGKPYSLGQLEKLCRKTGFGVCESQYALYVPPTKQPFILRHAGLFERFGKQWRAPLGGAVITRIQKDMYAGTVVRTMNDSRVKRFIMRPST